MSDSVPISSPARTISFVVPALNEEKNVEAAVAEIVKAADGRFPDWEVVLVNDGSTDGTAAVMERMAAANPHFRVVHNPTNLGFGGAYKRGVAAARCEFVMLVPADNEHPAEGLIPILDAVGRADIVIPYVENTGARSFFRRKASTGFTTLINLMFGLHVRYYNGLVVHRTRLVQAVGIETNGFGYQAEALVKLLRQGHSYFEIGTVVSERKSGQSSALKPRNLWILFKGLLRLYSQSR